MNSNSNSKKRSKDVKEYTFFLDFIKVTGSVTAFIWKRPKICYAGDKKASLVKDGVLIASNHVTWTDPIMLYCVFWRRRLRFWATKDLFQKPLVNFLFRSAGCIPIDKDNFNMATLRHSVDLLKNGKALLIFPEGEVNQQGETLSFKSGIVLMSQLSGAPIQPVFLVRPKKWYHRNVAIVGEPIDVRGMCSRFPTVDELQTVSEKVRERELALEEHYNNVISKKSKDRKGEDL